MWRMLVLVVVSANPQFGLKTGSSGRPPPPAAVCDRNRAPPDRSCSADSDCVVLRRSLGCCGTLDIRGVNRADVARVQQQDSVCRRGEARCKCAPGPTTLDDGTRLEGNEPVGVACVQQQCTTFVQPAPPPEPSGAMTSAQAAQLPRCAPAQCGPAPMNPTGVCPDGVSVFGRGPCVRIEGRCGWVQLACP